MTGAATQKAFKTWRGVSGQLHPVAVYDLVAAAIPEDARCAAIAVRRDDKGIAHPEIAEILGPGELCLPPRHWIALARRRGATELHIAIPDPATDPVAVIDDLREG